MLQENENAKSMAAKSGAMMSKPGAAAAPSRKFGTSLSINTNVPVQSSLPGKGLAPTSQAPKPVVPASSYTIAAAPLDNVTAADIAGAMDIDVADR